MKVLQVTERYPPAIGGVETHVENISLELSRLGVDVAVLTTDLMSVAPFRRLAGVTSSSEERIQGIRVLRERAYEVLPLPQGLGVVAPAMARRLGGFDLIHCHSYGHFPTFLAPLCAAKGIPCVITTHSDLGRYSFRKRAFDVVVPRATLSFASRIIALTNHEREALVQRGVKESAIEVIPNGVRVLPWKPHVKRNEGGRLLLYVGRVEIDQKGLDVLLRALDMLLREHRLPVHLRIVGPDGGGLARLEKLASELRVSEMVEYLGVVSREGLADTMAEADVLVLP